MNEELLQKKLARANRRIEILEGMIEDKTRELFLSNQELTSALRYLEQVTRILPCALMIVEQDGGVKEANDAAARLIGRSKEELVGSRATDVWPEAATATSIRANSGAAEGTETHWKTADGTPIPVLLSVTPFDTTGDGKSELICLATDIRERKSMEVELRHAQKLESVGQLAAGVAHEINTPMQFIGDNVHFLRDAFQDVLSLLTVYEKVRDVLPTGTIAKELREELDEAEEVADVEYLQERAPKAFSRTLDGVSRVSGIVAAMKAFSHPQNDKAPTDLNQAIETTLTVAKNEYKYIADVETELGDLPAVVCHGGDINQVLLNLIVNAAHAIEDSRGESEERGEIRIRSFLERDAAVIAIEDSGCGIPEDVQARIFDPFFTTKQVGRGSGQGLTIAHKIIRDKHGGTLSFETELGRGTTFFIRLPIDPSLQRAKEDAA